MSHYFDSNPNVAHHEKTISFQIFEQQISLLTDSGVFSKNRIDEGTLAFLKVLVPLKLSGNILDIGCGYGPIGLTIAMTSQKARITLADINSRALALASKNAELLNLSQRVTCLQSDVYSNIEGQYEAIVCNPPIRAGKKVTYAIYEGAKQYLTDGGSLYIVIRKAQGAESASKYIETVFGNVSLLSRNKGYYIYQAINRATEN